MRGDAGHVSPKHFELWKECNSIGNRGSTQEPQWIGNRARLRAPDWHRGGACLSRRRCVGCLGCLQRCRPSDRRGRVVPRSKQPRRRASGRALTQGLDFRTPGLGRNRTEDIVVHHILAPICRIKPTPRTMPPPNTCSSMCIAGNQLLTKSRKALFLMCARLQTPQPASRMTS